MDEQRFSVSKLGLYGMCPMAYWFKYHSAATPIRSSGQAAILGSLFHRMIESALATWYETDRPAAGIEAMVNYEFPPLTVQDKWKTKLKRWAQWYAGPIFDQFVGVLRVGSGAGVEVKLSTEFAGVQLVGFIDAVLYDRNGKICVVDWKMRGRGYPPAAVKMDRQLPLYVEGLRRQFGIDADRAMQIELNTSKKGMKILESDLSRAPIMIDAAQRLIEDIRRAERAEWFHPVHKAYICKDCDFLPYCENKHEEEKDTAR